MPRVNLHTFLLEREICHPSRPDRIEVDSVKLSVTIKGCPWWRGVEFSEDEPDGEIIFEFDGIGEGLIDTSLIWPSTYDLTHDEFLESFEICLCSEEEWAHGYFTSLYCSDPVKDLMNILVAAESHVVKNNYPDEVLKYFNSGNLGELVRISAASAYKFFEGPVALCKVVENELDLQGVRYNRLDTREIKADKKYSIHIGQSFFSCQSAHAIFNEECQ